MYVKFSPGDLNDDPCPPHPTSTYTCGVTIALRVCGNIYLFLRKGSMHIIMIDYSKKLLIQY